MRNVKDYGAVGDGVSLDTKAIQKAIDLGGTVYIPKGIYRVGTLYLRSNGGLHLAAGATLLASHERKDYNADDFCVQNVVSASEKVTGAHLICAIEQENITIEGHGTIDGQGDFWMNESNTQLGWPNADDRDYAPNENRPGQMIFICECNNVHVTDVNIVNGPYWHLFFHGCDNVHARGLKIKGDLPRWTNDGIDIDCCSRVTVSDCVIEVGDDAITLRGHDAPLKTQKKCEKITVTNCVLYSHRDYGIRIGVGDGLICDCVISNVTIDAPNYVGIGMLGRWSDTSRTVSSIENICISNVNIHSRCPLEICAAYGEKPLAHACHIRNIMMNNIMLFTGKNNIIRGFPGAALENVILGNAILQPDKNADEKVFQISSAEGVLLDNIKIVGEDNAGERICFDNCKNSKVHIERIEC